MSRMSQLQEKQDEMRRRHTQEKEKRSFTPSPTPSPMVQTCTRLPPHVCKVNGPCNGWPRTERKKCIFCKRRWAREGTAYCSRCNAKDLINNLRDTLPGMPVQEKPTELDKHQEELLYIDPEKRTKLVYADSVLDEIKDGYSRAQVAEMIGVSCTTLCRWEKKGKIPQPKRLVHSNACIYSEEIVAAAREYKNQSYVPPSIPAVPGTPDARLPFAAKKTLKVNRKLERVVATRIGTGRSML